MKIVLWVISVVGFFVGIVELSNLQINPEGVITNPNHHLVLIRLTIEAVGLLIIAVLAYIATVLIDIRKAV